MRHVSPLQFGDQIEGPMSSLYNDINVNKVERINVNFMARGDPMMNKYIMGDWDAVSGCISGRIEEYMRDISTSHADSHIPHVDVRFNISTIMPSHLASQPRTLAEIFKCVPTIHKRTGVVRMYYSLYSTRDNFRQLWLPGSMNYKLALDMLRQYNTDAIANGDKNGVTLHWAIIKNHNDDLEDYKQIAEELSRRNMIIPFNIVRYNPPPGTTTTEACPERIGQIATYMRSICSKVTVVPRVGEDVAASCGMFISDHAIS
jgi:adenine C2-methylase RlmN of 23S rRNA A2503 and tRNA A37